MSKNIITLEEQKHLAVSFPSLFQNLSTVEVDSILEGLGLDQIVNPEGGVIPKYNLDVTSDKPVYITNSFDIKIKGTLFNYYADESEKITSWSWSRDSGNTSEDTNWAIGKNTRELVLTETDFTSRISNTDIVFTLTASIGSLVFTDTITFSKFQTLSKVNIKTSSSIFLGNTPENILLETETSENIVSYKWFANNSLVAVTPTYTLNVLEVALKSIVNIKLEVINDKGEVLTDFISIPRIANGNTGGPGVPGSPGEDGTSTYTWVKYADDENGLNMSDNPTDTFGEIKLYIGIAFNKSTPTKSTDPSDYVWSKYIGDQGIPGDSVLSSIVFKRSANTPTTPTGGNYLNPVPSGWSDGIPDVEQDFPVWMSTRVFTLSGNTPQDSIWSEPQITSDTATLDFDWSSSDVVDPGTPDAPLNGAVWNEISDINNIWMAIQRTVNGEKQPWEIKKIKGEKGIDGQSTLTSFVFKRSPDNSVITTKPTGGSYENSVPSGWSDGIPSGVGAVYQSTRRFTKDGLAPQEAEWSTPVLAQDTQYKDYAYSDSSTLPTSPPDTQNPLQDGSVWHNSPEEGDIWQAVRTVQNNVYGPWTVQRIKGEKGISSYIWVKYSEYPNGRDTNGDVNLYDVPFIDEPQGRENFTYLGLAYNKQVQTKSLIPEDYLWSKILGEDGHTAYMLDLSNDNVSVPAQGDGTIPNPSVAFSLANTVLTLYYGNEVVDRAEYNIVLTASTGITYTTTDSYHNIQITGLTTDTGEIVAKIYPSNDPAKLLSTATFSIVKVKGSFSYEILPSTNVVKINSNPGAPQSMVPDAVQVKVKVNYGDSVEYTTAGNMTFRYVYQSTIGTDDDGAPYDIGTIMDLSNAGDPLYLEFKYFHPVTNILVDRERIPFVRDGVNGLTVEFRYAKNIDPLIPPTIDRSATNPTGWTTAAPTLALDEVLWMTKVSKYQQGGAMVGQWDIPVRISGTSGEPGINGTTGPSPRLLEFVDGASYENGGLYIDYAYFRSNTPSTEGWYTVKLPTGHTPGTVVTKVYSGGVPSASDFNKAPFTKEMSFGTIVAEQANLAGFIFRNQVLQSQQRENLGSCHPLAGTSVPNLSLDGVDGVVKFLDRLILNRDGLAFKDTCGRPRIVFRLDATGVPILRFLDEGGVTTWEAGKDGYKPIYIETRAESYTPLKGHYLATQPNGTFTEVRNIIRFQACSAFPNMYYYNNNNYFYGLTPIGYLYDKGVPLSGTYTPEQNAADGKYFNSNDITSGFIADGFYFVGFYLTTMPGETSEWEVRANWIQIQNGSQIGIEFNIAYPLSSMSMQACTTEQMNTWEAAF